MWRPVVFLVLLVLLLLWGSACVTPGDLHDVALTIDQLAEDLEDESKTVEEVQASVAMASGKIAEVAEGAIERAEEGLSTIEAGGISSVIAGAATLALHLYRNQTRARGRAKTQGTG